MNVTGNITLSGTVDGIDIAVDVAANTAKNTNVSTSLSAGTVTATTYGITSDGGANDIVLPEANTTQAGLLGAAKWDEIVANSTKSTNATHTGDVTGSSALTISVGAVDIAMLSASGTPTSSVFLRGDNTWATPSGAGDVSRSGVPLDNQIAVWTSDTVIEGTTGLTYDGTNLGITGNIVVSGTVDGIDIATDVAANTLKDTNVTTDLSLGSLTATTMDVDSSDGTNATLIEADTTNAGILGSNKWDEIVANSLKTSNADHTGDVTGATALTIANGAVDIIHLSASGTPSSTTYLRGDNTWTNPTDGYVKKTGTPVDNQIAIFTDVDIIEGDSNLTWDGSKMTLSNGTYSTIIEPETIDFSRDSINYVHCSTSGGYLAFVPNGLAKSAANASLTLTSDGRVAIGNEIAPDSLLHVRSTSGLAHITIDSDLTSHNAGVDFKVNNVSKWTLRTTGSSDNIGFYDGTDYIFYIDRTNGYVGVDETTLTEKLHVNGNIRAEIHKVYDGTDYCGWVSGLYTSSSDNYVWLANNTADSGLKIYNTGYSVFDNRVGIDVMPDVKLHVKADGTSSSVDVLRLIDSADVTKFNITENGIIHSKPTYNNTDAVNSANMYVGINGLFFRSTASSKRYKKNIDYNILTGNEILDLKPVRHNYKKSHYKDDKTFFYGFIAEDMVDKYPELVDWESGIPENVNYPKITVLLTAAAKKQQKEIELIKKHLNLK